LPRCPSLSLAFSSQIAKQLSLFGGEVFVLVLIEQIEQLNLLIGHEVQVQIPEAATFALATAGIGSTRFADAAQTLYNASALRIVEQIGLNSAQHLR
jgi:hypothetical protein